MCQSEYQNQRWKNRSSETTPVSSVMLLHDSHFIDEWLFHNHSGISRRVEQPLRQSGEK